MKMFDGGKFLQEHACQVKFSNGLVAEVTEVQPVVLEEMQKLGDESKAEDTYMVAAKVLGCERKSLDGVGMVELRGALDFLFGSLFPQK